MSARIITGVGLLGLLIVALYFGGWVFSLLWIACVCIALYEIFRALSKAGHRPVAWPTWAALIIAIPGFLFASSDQPFAVGQLDRLNPINCFSPGHVS